METPRPDPASHALRPPLPRACSTSLRVRYHECDPMGVAHHASYVPWLEMGRTELLRESGVSYAELEREGVFLVIVRLNVTYKRPIRYDDVVEVVTSIRPGSRIKIEHTYELRVTAPATSVLGSIRAASTGAPAADASPFTAATAETTLACVDATGKVRPLPEWLVVR